MDVRLYDAASDRADVDSWCTGWGLPTFPERWLSDAGFIVPGVFAAWLYTTNSGVAFMECMISNRDAAPDERDKAIDAVTRVICAAAAERGYEYVQGWSRLPTVVARAERLGFVACDAVYAPLIRRLG